MDPLDSIDAEAAKIEAPAAAGGGLLSDRLKALIMPNPATPGQFREDVLARTTNGLLGEAAGQAEVGESVALCASVLFPGGAGLGIPPAGWLGWSLVKWFLLKRARPAQHLAGEPVSGAGAVG